MSIEGTITTRNGLRVVLRPARPEDAAQTLDALNEALAVLHEDKVVG